FFFFQAEDGIRDRNVTGVQTCALPISGFSATGTPSRAASRRTAFLSGIAPRGNKENESCPRVVAKRNQLWSRAGSRARCNSGPRSEERRVGKECRWRWGVGGEKKERER